MLAALFIYTLFRVLLLSICELARLRVSPKEKTEA